MKAFNPRNGRWIASKVIEADTVFKRMRGLLGRVGLPPGEALLLTPCKSVHTLGMKFPIDVLFLSKDNLVVGKAEKIPPYRFSPFFWRALSALELSEGTISATDTRVGDRVEFS